MMIDTDKFYAIRDAVGAPPGADAKVVMAHAVKMRSDLNVISIEFERIKQDVKRQALGILGVVGLTFDDLHAWVVKKEEKKKT